MYFSSPYNEDRLVSLLQSGNRKAFDELYYRFAPSLLGRLIRIVHNQEQAEDLLQDSFVKIWLNLHQFDPGKGRLYTWMVRIAHNLALNYLRSQAGVNRDMDNLPLDMLGSVTPTYNGIGLLHWINTTLTPNQLSLLNMIYFQGYTYQEISDEVGTPLGTVKTGVRQALIRLRTIDMRYTQAYKRDYR